MFCLACGANNAPSARFCGSCGKPLAAPTPAVAPGPAAAAAAPATAPAPAASEPGLASLGDRVLAVMLDSLLMAAAFAVIGMAVARRMGGLTDSGFSVEGKPALVIFGLVGIAGFLYYWLLEGLFGATLGKAIMGIAVRRTGGGACGLGASLGRNLLRIIDAIGVYLVGFLVAVLSKSRQRIGDHVAGTVVVRRGTRKALRAALVVLWLAALAGGIAGAWLLHRLGGEFGVTEFAFLEAQSGPPRVEAPYKPGETVYTKFTIAGFGAREDRVDFLVRVTPIDPNGLRLHQTWEDRTAQRMGGKTMNFTFHFQLPPFAPPGKYTFDIRANDAVRGAAAALAPGFRVEGPAPVPASQLEVRNFRFSATKGGPPETPFVTHSGSTVHTHAEIAGIQFRGDRPDTQVAFQLLGPAGDVLLEKADFLIISGETPYHPPTYYEPIHGWFTLPSDAPNGAYTVRYTVTDRLAGRDLVHEGKFEVQ